MATRIFIDGYNFLWASDRHRPEAIHNFEEARNHMVERLSRNELLARHHVTIIFDAHKTDSLDSSSESIHGIEVQYTRGGQDADSVLKKRATEFGNSAIIISSDREVARFAEKKGCGVLGSHEFDRILFQLPDPDPANRLPKAKRQALARLRG